MVICWTGRHISTCMLTYIYLNVDECWLTSSMPEQRYQLQISLNYANILKPCWVPIVCIYTCYKSKGRNNVMHGWTKTRWPGVVGIKNNAFLAILFSFRQLSKISMLLIITIYLDECYCIHICLLVVPFLLHSLFNNYIHCRRNYTFAYSATCEGCKK